MPANAGIDLLGVNDLPHRSFPALKRRLILPKAGLRDIAAMDERGVRTLATTSEQMIAMELGDADLVVPVAGLGGETGGWGSALVARVAALKRATTLAVVTMPFSAEGANRRSAASDALVVLRRHAHGVLVLRNDMLLKVASHLPLLRAFEMMCQVVIRPIHDLHRAASREDLPTLQSVLRNASQWSLGIGEGFRDRPELAAVDSAFRSPWLAGSPETAREVILVMHVPEVDERSVRDVLHDADLRAPRASVTWGALRSDDAETARVTLLIGN